MNSLTVSQKEVLNDMKSNDWYWSSKPLWCRPWTIILTGILLIFCSFYFLGSIIVTSLVSLFIFIWWFLFLFLAPDYYNK